MVVQDVNILDMIGMDIKLVIVVLNLNKKDVYFILIVVVIGYVQKDIV